MASGCITVPAYTTYTKKDFEYIIDDSEAKLAFISNQNLFNNFIQAAKNKKKLKNIITFKKINYKKKKKKVIYVEEIYKSKNCNKFKIFLNSASLHPSINPCIPVFTTWRNGPLCLIQLAIKSTASRTSTMWIWVPSTSIEGMSFFESFILDCRLGPLLY